MFTLNKRVFDLALGTLLAVAAIPVIGVLAVGVALTLKTWPFFVQNRVGKGGRHFRFLKLRSLPPTSPAYADKYAIRQIKIPRFTRFLRKTHLDELPQLFLVPLGRMSLVGPRPEMPTLHDAADPHFASLRTKVRPGCAGLWQAGADYHKLIWEAPEYDVFYLRHRSVRFDLWILWRTVLVMLHLARPVTLADVPRWVLASGSRAQILPMPDMAATSELPAAAAS